MYTYPIRAAALLLCGLPALALAENPVQPEPEAGTPAGVQPVLPEGDVEVAITVDARGGKKNNPPTSVPRKITLTRVGETARYLLEWEKGKDTVVWMDMKSGLRVEKSGERVSVARGERGSVPPLAALDEASIRWMRAEDRQGEVMFKGKPAVHYKRKYRVEVTEAEPQPAELVYEAWIDPETGALLATRDRQGTYVFEVSPTQPTRKLTMPEEHAREIQRYTKMLAPPSHL